MSFYTEEKRILQNALNEGKLIIFVGAGVSVPSGMPLWKDALKPFQTGLGINDTNAYDNLRIPQMYYNARGQKEYVDLARKVFRYGENLIPNRIHDCIMKMNVNQIITTNYDHLLEEAALKHNRIYKVLSKDEDIPYASGNRRIIKMHGDFENNNFVLKEDDYLNYSNQFSLIETYCKAAIASNVVLFVGYSFNDPDVKQIFNWIKVTLKNDFQRAYLIDAVNEYADHDVQYFRNRGVNLLYASKEIEGYKKKEIEIRTLEMLQYFFFEKKDSRDLISRLYEELQGQSFLSYIPRKYVLGALRECGLVEDQRYIRIYKADMKKYQSDLKRIAKTSTEAKIQLIQKAFRDCEIKGVFVEDGVKKSVISFQYELTDQSNEIEKYLWEFDFSGLRQYMKELECLSLEENLSRKQELLYGYYEIGEHEKAFGLAKQISMAYYRKGNLPLFFISEYNRRILALLLSGPMGMRDADRLLEGDCSEKRLEEILTEMSYSQDKSYKFLNDLLQENYKEKYYEESVELKDKEKEQAETCYVFFGDEAAVDQLRSLERDFYNCQIKNLLLGDCFIESRRVFRMGSKALLESLGKGKVIRNNPDFGDDTSENVVLDELIPEDIFYILKYMPVKQLREAFREYKIQQLPVGKETIEYLQLVLQNIYKYLKLADCRKKVTEDYLNVIGLLLGKMELSKELETIYLQAVLKAMQMNLLEQNTDIVSNCILKFVQKEASPEFKDILKQLLDVLLNKALKNLHYVEHTGRYLFINLIQILSKEYQYILEEQWVGRLKQNNSMIILPQISHICSDREKKEIKEFITDEWEKNGKITIALYERAVMEELIQPSEIYENMAYQALEEAEENPGNYMPNRYIESMHHMITLYLNGKLINSDKLKEKMMVSERMQWIFLADLDHFNYEMFIPEWLTEFSMSLCKSIAENERAKSEISQRIKQIWINERRCLNEEVLNRYFNYFA